MLAVDAVEGLAIEPLLAAIHASRTAFWDDPERAERGRRDLRAASTEVLTLAFEALGVEVSSGLPRAVAEDYRDRRDADMALFPEATRVLDDLRAAGLRLGLVTNGSAFDQRAKIDRFELEGYFEHIQIEGEFGIGKPKPEAYAHALASIGAAADEKWFIGDNIEWDVAAPQRHGIFGVWVSLGRTLPADSPTAPDHTIEGITDLVAPA
jgi:putative hydrolase of the HAD superfamily